jgi:hypothetical protein
VLLYFDIHIYVGSDLHNFGLKVRRLATQT